MSGSNAKGVCDEVVRSDAEDEIHKSVNAAPAAPGRSRKESTTAGAEGSGGTPPEGESVPAKTNGVHVERGDEELSKHHLGKSRFLKNSQVKRKILLEEPSRTEPSRTEPSRTEPSRTEPSRTEPSRTEPSRTDPSRTEPSSTEPSSTQQYPSRSTSENSSSSASRHTKRRSSSSVPVYAQNGSLDDSSDTAMDIFMRSEDEGGMVTDTFPPTTERMNSQQNSSSVHDVNREEAPPVSARQDLVVLNRKQLLGLFERVAHMTESCSVEQMEALHSTLEHLVFRHRMKTDRSQLLKVRSHSVYTLASFPGWGRSSFATSRTSNCILG